MLRVHEVSPVLRGAGVGTRTLAAKTNDDDVEARELARMLRGQYDEREREELTRIRDQVQLEAIRAAWL